MSGWQGSNRREQLPKNWQNIRRRILTRDRHRCQHVRADTGTPCGWPANQVDHIDQNAHDDHSDANLQALCDYHHARKSASEGGRAAAKKRHTPPR